MHLSTKNVFPAIYFLLARDLEDRPWWYPRHPLIATSNTLTAAGFTYWWLITDPRHWTGDLAFLSTILLFIVSSQQHWWPENSTINLLDQLMISQYIVLIPLPAVYAVNPAALSYVPFLLGCTMAMKWHFNGKEPHHFACAWFLTLGGVSLLVLTLYSEADPVSLVIATALFILVELVYWHGGLFPLPRGRIIAYPEQKHAFLVPATVVFTSLISLPAMQ